MKQIFHFVYKTVNRVTGQYYIGKHSTTNINDNYLGSSKPLRKDISRYGIESFERHIIAFCESSEAAYATEAKFISYDDLKNPLCYNRTLGGCGGDKSSSISKESRISAGNKISNMITITDGVSEKRIPAVVEIPYGWRRGRRPSFYSNASTTRLSYHWISNGVEKKTISRTEEIPPGWERCPNPGGRFPDYIRITDGTHERLISPVSTIPEGWWKGRKPLKPRNLT